MFKSFDENKFWQAINEKDFSRLKINTVSAIRNDPTFSNSETTQVLKILDEKVPEIFEDEVDLGYEERLEQAEWTKDYFAKLTYWFQKNFTKSRLPHIKEVGKAVHSTPEKKITPNTVKKAPAKTTSTSPSQKQAPKKSTKPNPPQAPERTKKWPLIVGGIAAATALVLIIVLLVKSLTK